MFLLRIWWFIQSLVGYTVEDVRIGQEIIQRPKFSLAVYRHFYFWFTCLGYRRETPLFPF